MLRQMRNPQAPRVARLRQLLEAEIGRGSCDQDVANGLITLFMSFEIDFSIDSSGVLRWWRLSDSSYSEMCGREQIQPNE